MLARSLIERKEWARAVALLEALIGEIPAGGVRQQDLESRYLLALGYEGLERYEDALAALQTVVDKAKGPLKSDAQLNSGTLLMALKRHAEAVAPLEAFLAGKPTGDVEAKALAALAICHARAKQIDKAKQRYAELMEKYPRHALIAPTTERLAEAAFDANDAGVGGGIVEAAGRRRRVGRIRIERQAQSRLEPVQGGKAGRGRRDVRGVAQEESARGDCRRGRLRARPHPCRNLARTKRRWQCTIW